MDSHPGRPEEAAPGGNPPPATQGTPQPPPDASGQHPAQDDPGQPSQDPAQPQHAEHPQGSHLYPQQPGPYGPPPGVPPHPGPYAQQPPYPQQPGPYGHQPYPQQPGPYPGGQPQQYPGAPYAQQYPGQPHAQQYPGPPHAQQYPGPVQYPGMYPGQPVAPWMRPAEPRVFPTPPDTPYHRLARNAKHTWWRPIVGTLVLVAGAIVLTMAVVIPWMIVHTILVGDLFDTTPTTDELFANVNEEIAIALISLGILTPAVLFTVRFIQRRPAWSIASVLGRIRWRWLLLCCLPALAYVAISYLLGIVVELIFPSADTPADEGSWVGFGAFIVPALIIICLVPFQSAAEEFVFRGWVIQAIGSYGPDRVEGKAQWLKRALRTPWPGIVVTSILFVAAHGYRDWAMADIFLFAMLVGWLTVHTGGLEAAIALHVLNNLAAFGVSAATGQLEGWDVQGSAPWTTLLVDIPAFGAFGVLVVWLAKRKQIARVSPAAVQG